MSTDLPTPTPTPRPVPPNGEPELPTREVDELGDDEDLPTEPGTGGEEQPEDDDPAPWPSSAPADGVPMTFRDVDGRVHLSTDMQPGDQRRAGEAPGMRLGSTPGLLRS